MIYDERSSEIPSSIKSLDTPFSRGSIALTFAIDWGPREIRNHDRQWRNWQWWNRGMRLYRDVLQRTKEERILSVVPMEFLKLPINAGEPMRQFSWDVSKDKNWVLAAYFKRFYVFKISILFWWGNNWLQRGSAERHCSSLLPMAGKKNDAENEDVIELWPLTTMKRLSSAVPDISRCKVHSNVTE